ncbi:MAG: tetratricopeptide repeat protein, partial [Candidatus Pacebacteria bacterium]|nr:tetratricopeptide repeat protein [Candidatus Paceibacterota bacterium]
MNSFDELIETQLNRSTIFGIVDREIASPEFAINNPEELMKTIVRANDGDPQHQYNLAVHFDLVNNKEFAVYWYGLAADHGIPKAMFNLAVLLYHGKGITKNRALAAKWFRLAADKGVKYAMYNM